MSDQPQVRLKRKVTLRRKEEAAFTFTGRLKVRLLWQSETDLDLCLFFKKRMEKWAACFPISSAAA